MSTAATPQNPPRRFSLDVLGPVLQWELITIARRWRFFAVRILYAVILAVTLWTIYRSVFRYSIYNQDITRFSEFASMFSTAVLWVQMIATLVLTPAFVGSAIANEKERRTIDYLFASDLSNREIVIGKLFARTSTLVSILLSAVPIVALAGLFGGIDYWLIFLGTSMNLALLFSAASLTIALSLHSRTTRQALTGCYVWLFFLLISPYLVMMAGMAIYAIIHYVDPGLASQLEVLFTEQLFMWLGQGVAIIHPFVAFLILSISASGMGMGAMWGLSSDLMAVAFVATHLVLGVVLTTYTSLQLRRVSSRHADGPGPRARALQQFRAWRASRRRPVPQSWPLAWKEIHAASTRRMSMGLRVLVAMVVVGFYGLLVGLSQVQRITPEDIGMITRSATVIFAFFVYFLLAFRSSSTIGEERDRDCWVSLLSTPLSAEEIIWSKMLGTLAFGTRMLLFLAPLWAIAWMAGEMKVLGILIGLLAYVSYAAALIGMGVFQSLIQKTTGRAIMATLVIAAVCWGGAQMFLMPLMMFGRGDDSVMMMYVASIPWSVLASVPFDGTEDWRRSPSTDSFYFFATIFVILHGFAGVMLTAFAAAIFPRVTGRVEHRLASEHVAPTGENPRSGEAPS